MRINERLQFLRKAAGLSEHEVSDALGVSRSNIRNWELGIRNIKADTICQLADFYGVTADYLLGREPTDTIDDNSIVLDGLYKTMEEALFHIQTGNKLLKQVYCCLEEMKHG